MEWAKDNHGLRILLTGGPSTGKSTLLELLDSRGFTCYPEEIRLLTREILEEKESPESVENPLLFAADPIAFNNRLIQKRLRQWLDFEERKLPLAFYDRGIPDVLAYMNIFGQDYPDHFHQIALQHRYDLVFLAPVWPEIFHNDPERMETMETALRAESALRQTYTDYGYDLISIPFAPVEERADFLTEFLMRTGIDLNKSGRH